MLGYLSNVFSSIPHADLVSDWRAAYTLEKILKTDKQYSQVAFKLKHHLNPEVRRFNPYLYDESHSLIWHCAQNLPYPEFYRAWHGDNQTAQFYLRLLTQQLITAIAKIARRFNFSILE